MPVPGKALACGGFEIAGLDPLVALDLVTRDAVVVGIS